MNSSAFEQANISRASTLLWTSVDIDRQRPTLVVCSIASVIHALFWLQLMFSASLRHRSMQWIYAYLITDGFLLVQFFFTHTVQKTSAGHFPDTTWRFMVCYFEGTFDNYLNILEVYILLALNISRYLQVAYNRNVYTNDQRLLLVTHAVIYLLPLVGLVILFLVGLALLDVSDDGICDVHYTSVYVQVFAFLTGYVLPICLNVLVIYGGIRHVDLASALRRTQHHATAREKYHRSLVTQFVIFYIIWLALWSPNVIVYQFTSGMVRVTQNVRLLNFIEIGLDPVIVTALDMRFWHVWRKRWSKVKHKWRNDVQQLGVRVGPLTPNRIAPVGERNQQTAP